MMTCPALAHEEAPSQEERRRHSRVPAPPVRIGDVHALMHDVSLGGACLVLPSPHLLPDRCELLLTDLRSGTTQTLKAAVVSRRGHTVGLRWQDLHAAQVEWLKARLVEWEDAIGAPVARVSPLQSRCNGSL